jgi:hypothetical protein
LLVPTTGTTENLYKIHTLTLEQSSYTKCELRQQTAWTLDFVKTATNREICLLNMHFSYTAEYALTEMDIVTHDMARLRKTKLK